MQDVFHLFFFSGEIQWRPIIPRLEIELFCTSITLRLAMMAKNRIALHWVHPLLQIILERFIMDFIAQREFRKSCDLHLPWPHKSSQWGHVGPLWNLLLDIATRLSSIAKFEREKNMNPHPHTTEHSWNGPLNPKPWFLGGVFNTVSGGIDEWTSRILHVTPGTGGHCLCCAALRRVWGASWFSTQSRHHEMTQSIGFCSSYARPNRYNLLKTMLDGRACPPLPFLAQTRRLDLPTLKWLDGWCWFEMVMYLSSSWNRRSQTDFVSMFFHQRAVKKSPMDRTEIPIDIQYSFTSCKPSECMPSDIAYFLLTYGIYEWYFYMSVTSSHIFPWLVLFSL